MLIKLGRSNGTQGHGTLNTNNTVYSIFHISGPSGSWCSGKYEVTQDKIPFLQVDLGQRIMFCRLALQGDDDRKSWVRSFKMRFSDDKKKWDTYQEEGKDKVWGEI